MVVVMVGCGSGARWIVLLLCLILCKIGWARRLLVGISRFVVTLAFFFGYCDVILNVTQCASGMVPLVFELLWFEKVLDLGVVAVTLPLS